MGVICIGEPGKYWKINAYDPHPLFFTTSSNYNIGIDSFLMELQNEFILLLIRIYRWIFYSGMDLNILITTF